MFSAYFLVSAILNQAIFSRRFSKILLKRQTITVLRFFVLDQRTHRLYDISFYLFLYYIVVLSLTSIKLLEQISKTINNRFYRIS